MSFKKIVCLVAIQLISVSIAQDNLHVNEELGHGINKRAAVSNDSFLWPGGVVKYFLDQSSQMKLWAIHNKIIQEIMDEFHNKTCIKFKPTNDIADFVLFRNHYSLGNNSVENSFGYSGSRQSFALSSIKIHKWEILRGFMKMLGFYPEEWRVDRNESFQIKDRRLGTVVEPVDKDWWAQYWGGYNDLDVPYDFCSVMQWPLNYQEHWFIKTPLKTYNCSEPVGYATHLSDLDVLKINKLYNCTA